MPTPQIKSTPALTSVFSCLYHAEDARTKQEIARETGLSLPTVYQALSGLEELGLLASGSSRQSTGGRRAATLALDCSRMGALGVSITGNHLRIVGCDLRGNQLDDVIGSRRLEGPLSVAELAGALEAGVADGIGAMKARGTRVVGIGIAVPSAVDPATGRLLNSRVLRVTDAELCATDLTERLPLPAAVFNDANCGAFSEVFPAHEGQNIAYLSLERGVGGAMIIDGRPYAGVNGASAEFGHICVEPGGRACNCGRAGCLEAYCSSARLSDELGISLDEFFERFDSGDEQAVELFVDYADHLVRGIQTIRTIMDCDVVLGGFMAPYLRFYFDFIAERAMALDPLRGGVPYLRYARHPHHGVPLGAAQQMAQRFIEGL